MENRREATKRLKDAQRYLQSAEKYYKLKDWRIAVQNSQLAIEFSAKGIIACFEEPKWTHDPSDELDHIVSTNKDKIIGAFGEKMIILLQTLSSDAEEASDWHGWSTYGREGVSPFDLCTYEVAHSLLEKAKRSYDTAAMFIESWLNIGGGKCKEK
ncbi:MAG TPA: HEPN domain-containing protein [bacterium (Candidatus Stahlbacteria)]|nr:HEPN domain-containing protein [Candidatus Stahlbacteria bacterium]